MSLRFRNELRMELRMGSCHVEMSGRGWRPRPAAVADGTGAGAAALSAALQALRLTEIESLPTVARLTVADEYVYYALLDEGLSPQAAREQAQLRFADVLERSDLRVQVMPLGGSSASRRWLAAAVAEQDLQAWSDAMAQVGVRLTHLHAALIEDLRQLADQIREDDAVIALLRDEGVSLVRLREGLPIALAWERFDADLPDSLEQRLRAFIRAAAAEASVGHQCVIYLLPESKALCRYVWDGRDLPGLFRPPLGGIGTRAMARPPYGAQRAWADTVQLPATLAFPISALRGQAGADGPVAAPLPLPEVVEGMGAGMGEGMDGAGMPEWHGTPWRTAAETGSHRGP